MTSVPDPRYTFPPRKNAQSCPCPRLETSASALAATGSTSMIDPTTSAAIVKSFSIARFVAGSTRGLRCDANVPDGAWPSTSLRPVVVHVLIETLLCRWHDATAETPAPASAALPIFRPAAYLFDEALFGRPTPAEGPSRRGSTRHGDVSCDRLSSARLSLPRGEAWCGGGRNGGRGSAGIGGLSACPRSLPRSPASRSPELPSGRLRMTRLPRRSR